LSELFQFFVFAHASTLLACSLLCKPLVLLVSYEKDNSLSHEMRNEMEASEQKRDVIKRREGTRRKGCQGGPLGESVNTDGKILTSTAIEVPNWTAWDMLKAT
jgi:hypothetical protein